jgi:hypothetical protein
MGRGEGVGFLHGSHTLPPPLIMPGLDPGIFLCGWQGGHALEQHAKRVRSRHIQIKDEHVLSLLGFLHC